VFVALAPPSQHDRVAYQNMVGFQFLKIYVFSQRILTNKRIE
jgi:hypothetical protein